MTSVSNRNPSAEQLYREMEEQASSYPLDFSRKKVPIPNPVFQQKLHYYDSVVQNSHSFPNISHIKPYELNEIPATPSMFLNESIEKNKRFFYGGVFHPVEKVSLWG